MIMNDLWITRDGRVLYIQDMTDDHLTNAINYLRRSRRELKAMEKQLRRERWARRFAWLVGR